MPPLAPDPEQLEEGVASRARFDDLLGSHINHCPGDFLHHVHHRASPVGGVRLRGDRPASPQHHCQGVLDHQRTTIFPKLSLRCIFANAIRISSTEKTESTTALRRPAENAGSTCSSKARARDIFSSGARLRRTVPVKVRRLLSRVRRGTVASGPPRRPTSKR